MNAVATLPPASLWRHRDFLWMWAGQTVSEVGSGVSLLALPSLAVLSLGASGGELGLLEACARLPFPVLALLVGAFVDRVRRRPLMVAADAGRCLVVGLVPILAVAGLLRLWVLDTVSVAAGSLGVLFDIAYLASMPGLVGEAQLAEANQKLELTFSSAAVAGPGIGGLLVQAVGAARGIAADAVSYLASAASIAMIRRPEPAPPPASQRQRLRAELSEGIRHVVRDPVLFWLLVGMGTVVLALHAVETAFVLFAYRTLGLSPGIVGLLLTAGGIGTLAGAVLSRPADRWLGAGRAMGLAGVATGVLAALLPLALVLPTVPVVCLILIADGAAGSIQNVIQVTVRQLRTPARLRGRMNAAFRTVFWGAWPVGNLLGGVLVDAAGAVPLLVGSGVVAAIGGAVLVASPVGRVTTPASA